MINVLKSLIKNITGNANKAAGAKKIPGTLDFWQLLKELGPFLLVKNLSSSRERILFNGDRSIISGGLMNKMRINDDNGWVRLDLLNFRSTEMAKEEM